MLEPELLQTDEIPLRLQRGHDQMTQSFFEETQIAQTCQDLLKVSNLHPEVMALTLPAFVPRQGAGYALASTGGLHGGGSSVAAYQDSAIRASYTCNNLMWVQGYSPHRGLTLWHILLGAASGP